jgi:hypothetical protein
MTLEAALHIAAKMGLPLESLALSYLDGWVSERGCSHLSSGQIP